MSKTSNVSSKGPLSEEEHVSFSDEEPFLEKVEFFEISQGSYQPLNIVPYLSLYVRSTLFLYQI